MCQGGGRWGCGRGQAAGRGGGWPRCPCLCDAWSGGESLLEKKNQPFHPDPGMSLGARLGTLVLGKVAGGGGSGSSPRVVAVALPRPPAGTVTGTGGGSPRVRHVWAEVAGVTYPSQEELLLLQEEAESSVKCETWEEIKIPWQASPTVFALPILKSEKLRGLGPSTSIYLGLSAPNLPYFEHELRTWLRSGVTESCGMSSASSAPAA